LSKDLLSVGPSPLRMTGQGWNNQGPATSMMTHSMPAGLCAEVDLAGGQTLITIESTERMGSQATETKLSLDKGTDRPRVFLSNDPHFRLSGSSHPLSNSKLQDLQPSELNSQQQLTFLVEGLQE
jgi:hypothetical protein